MTNDRPRPAYRCIIPAARPYGYETYGENQKMTKLPTIKEFDAAAKVVRAHLDPIPQTAIVLGSGLGAFADSLTETREIPYRKIPGWPVSTVEGHAGVLAAGRLAGRSVLLLRGRVHYYEGYEIQQIGFPVRVLQRLGVCTLILTNAAGGIHPAFAAGDLMLITDHLNLIGIGGANPLRGPNDPRLGPRFPDMSAVYDPDLRWMTKAAAKRIRLPLREGVYAGVAGPSFETPAELRYLRQIGADAVGMSTVPEAIVARHAGLRVLGISAITNKAAPHTAGPISHLEVLETSARIAPKLDRLIQAILADGGYPW
jgi:purine-nucleoside phosphorylase